MEENKNKYMCPKTKECCENNDGPCVLGDIRDGQKELVPVHLPHGYDEHMPSILSTAAIVLSLIGLGLTVLRLLLI